MEKTNEIVVYQPNEILNLEVHVENESVWLSLNQMAMLFDRDKSVISRHISNIYKEKELAYRSFCRLEKTTCGSMGHFAG